MKRALTQQEIDAVFSGSSHAGDTTRSGIEAFDVRKLDKIPKSQLQTLHMVHENFARNLASSLSAYLRSYVVLNLVSMEQLSYGEFLEGVSTPACVAYIGLQPYNGSAVLDINSNLVFRFIELLLGSKEQSTAFQRKVTDIEKRLMQTLLRVVLRDLHDSWRSVAEIDFAVQSLASEPQLMYLLAPTEGMVVFCIEVRLGATSGLMNLAIPSIFIKRLRNNFNQVQRTRKAEAAEADQLRVAALLQEAKLRVDVRIPGGVVPARSLLDLKVGNVLVLDRLASGPISALLNGKQKWLGQVLASEGRLAFQIASGAEENPSREHKVA